MGKTFQTVARMGFIKTLLIVFNLIFWLSGLVIFSLGIWMELQLHKYLEVSNDFFSLVRIVVMGLGGFIIVLAMLACCCTARGMVPLLYIYSSLLMVIFCAQVLVFVIGYIYREKLSSGFHDGLGKGLQNYGKEPALTQAINNIQSTLYCCGLSNYTDWEGTPWGRGHPNKLPHSCCLYTKEAICAAKIDTAFVHRQGCYRVVVNFFMDNLSTVGIGILSIAGFHLLGVLLSCCLAKTINRAQYEEIREATTNQIHRVSHYYVSQPTSEAEVVLPQPQQYCAKSIEMTTLRQRAPSPPSGNYHHHSASTTGGDLTMNMNNPSRQSASSPSDTLPLQKPQVTQVQINQHQQAYHQELLNRVQSRNPHQSSSRRDIGSSNWSLCEDEDELGREGKEDEDIKELYGDTRTLNRRGSIEALDY